MVDRAALEMPCPERDPGFESLALRHRNAHLFEENEGAFFFFEAIDLLESSISCQLKSFVMIRPFANRQ